jgi:hypothetical protein
MDLFLQKAWWWLYRAETCRLECVFNNKWDVFDWKYLHFVKLFAKIKKKVTHEQFYTAPVYLQELDDFLRIYEFLSQSKHF